MFTEGSMLFWLLKRLHVPIWGFWHWPLLPSEERVKRYSYALNKEFQPLVQLWHGLAARQVSMDLLSDYGLSLGDWYWILSGVWVLWFGYYFTSMQRFCGLKILEKIGDWSYKNPWKEEVCAAVYCWPLSNMSWATHYMQIFFSTY